MIGAPSTYLGILFFFNLPIRRADLKQSNQIVIIRYIKQYRIQAENALHELYQKLYQKVTEQYKIRLFVLFGLLT